MLVFARNVDAVEKTAGLLRKQTHDDQVQTLTGTMRGQERDDFVEDAVFRRFLPEPENGWKVPTREGTVYLVCTSAGEVGVNLSARHLVCDLTPFDSMAQRFGRVNRFGVDTDTAVDVVHPSVLDPGNDYEARLHKTLALLERLDGSANPATLRCLDLTGAERKETFSREPDIVPVSPILFDAWALTSAGADLLGRPPVAPYLHGLDEGELPTTEIAWRQEVEVITGALLEAHPPAQLLELHQLETREILRDRSDRVWKHLEKMAQRKGDASVWIVDDKGQVEALPNLNLRELIARKERNKDCINHRPLLLPPSVGGLE